MEYGGTSRLPAPGKRICFLFVFPPLVSRRRLLELSFSRHNFAKPQNENAFKPFASCNSTFPSFRIPDHLSVSIMKSCFALLGLGAFLAALTVGAQPMSVSDGASQGEASLEEIARGIPDFLAHLADHSGSRRLSSPLDKMEVLIKNVDCFACLEAPPAPVLRHLRAEDEARELSPGADVFVNALNCDTNDPYQIWNLLSLEPTGTWFLFESAETGECMQLVGLCNPSGAAYDIEMGPCDPTNGKAFWAFTGVGYIVHYECLRSNWESDTRHHSTPDIFLEGSCGNTGGREYLGLSSHSADSIDQAENFWMLYPKTFGTLVPP